LRKKIISLGGEFLYQTKLTDLDIEESKLKRIQINGSTWIEAEVVVLAIGHSARDTFFMLSKYLNMESKPFAVGVRVMHSQERINDSQYGVSSKFLPPATYKLVYHTKDGRGVYSFCMCPGGYVVNASSEISCLAINGMSESQRDTQTANSAIVVTVSKADFGEDLFDGMKFQRELEENAYKIRNGKIPMQLYKDFLKNQESSSLGLVKPLVKGNVAFANLNDILPKFLTSSIKEAMPEFEKKISGFASDDVILLAVESRTSSPVRILREKYGVSNIDGVYPCGEGAGYAGGITSAAMDGLFIAEQIISKYQSF